MPGAYHLEVHCLDEVREVTSRDAMARLPRIEQIDANSAGTGFFLCARKERRTGRGGAFLIVRLQDTSGEITAKVFQDVVLTEAQFEAGEFVAVQAKGTLYNQRVELLVDKIRRVIPGDEDLGFREADCILSSPRPLDEMWHELESRMAAVADPHIRALLTRIVAEHGEKLRIWPAARQVHHAYRGGLLEHLLKMMEVAALLADAYGARRDLLIAGALLHDIGKLQELDYGPAVTYTVEGNLLGHITIGAAMVRDTVRDLPDFPPELALEIEHLVLSHHGERTLGSPVVPMTIEAFILSAVDDLDAKLNQVRRHVAGDDGAGRLTGYNRHLDRVLLKPPVE
jgi:3'-5' exoribonuclease